MPQNLPLKKSITLEGSLDLRRGLQAPRALQGLAQVMITMDPPVIKVILDQLELRAIQVQLDQQELKASKAILGPPEFKVSKETLVRLEIKELKVIQVQLEPRVFKVSKVIPVQLVRLEIKVFKEYRVILVLPELRVFRVSKVILVQQELKVYKASKDAYKRHAHAYYWDRSILYRHIVPSAFTSPMGPGLMSGKTAARIAMFFIRRGFHYVPVTYTGIAVLNYFSFLLDAPARRNAPALPHVIVESEPATT